MTKLRRQITLFLLAIVVALSVTTPRPLQAHTCDYPGYNLVVVHVWWLWLIYDAYYEEVYAEEPDPCSQLGISGYVSSCQIEFVAYCDVCHGCN